MPLEVPEDKSWDEFNDFIESASSEGLHALAAQYAECWKRSEAFGLCSLARIQRTKCFAL